MIPINMLDKMMDNGSSTDIGSEYLMEGLTPLDPKELEEKYQDVPGVMERLLQKAKYKYWSLLPAFQMLELQMVKEPVHHLATDGKHLFYNPDTVWEEFKRRGNRGMSKRLTREIVHIVLHGLLGHFWTDESYRDRKLVWAIMDLMADSFYKRCFSSSKENMIQDGDNPYYADGWEIAVLQSYDENNARLDALLEKGLEAYFVIRDQPGSRNFLLQKAYGTMYDNHRIWHGSDEKNKNRSGGKDINKEENGNEAGQKQKKESAEIQEEWKKARKSIMGISLDTKQMQSLSKKELESIIQASGQFNGKLAGTGSGSLEERYQASKDSRQNYTSVLRELIRERERTHEEPDSIDPMLYQYGLDIYGDVPLVEPLEENPKSVLENIVLAIDTSGSCSGDAASCFLGETYQMISDARVFTDVRNIYLVECDYKVQNTSHFTEAEELMSYVEDVQLHGFGGTAFEPVFEWIEENRKEMKEEVSALIYLTDGYGSYPAQQPDYPVYFVIPEDDYRGIQTELSERPWIKVVVLSKH